MSGVHDDSDRDGSDRRSRASDRERRRADSVDGSLTRGVRRARWSGLVRLALARFRGQLTGITPGRSVAIVLAVSLTLTLLLVVTGLALALVDDGTASQHDAVVQVEPDGGQTFSSIDGIERPRLANASTRSATIESAAGVEYASPVLAETVAATGTVDRGASENGTVEPGAVEYTRILAVGVEPDERAGVVAGLPVAALDSNATAPDGPDEDEGEAEDNASGAAAAIDGGAGVVLSERAAERLDASVGDDVYVSRGGDLFSLTVLAVEPATGSDDVPVALVELDVLQLYAGADAADLADRILIWGDEEAATTAGETAYPEASVDSSGSTHPAALFGDGLALATGLIALLVGVVICALFVATTAGMAVTEDRRQLATLVAVGFSGRSCLALVTVATLTTVLVGAVVGVALGAGAIYATDLLATALVGTESVVAFHPLFVPYAIGVALFAGTLAIPYPLVIAARTDVIAEVGR